MRGLCAVALVLITAGCSELTTPAPVGPRAIRDDLRPWLSDAPTVTFTGWLQNFDVWTSTGPGVYATWSVHTSIRNAAEVDVRGCPQLAERYRDQRVTITGRMIEREGYHFPLLVAEHIEPAGEAPAPVQVAGGL